jgi:PAS domain S-box-containing protein
MEHLNKVKNESDEFKNRKLGDGMIASTLFDADARIHTSKTRNVYRDIISVSNNCILILDANDCFLEQNESHRNLVGFSDEELKGKTSAFFLSDETYAMVQHELVKHGKFQGEVVSHTKNGNLVIDLNSFILKDAHGGKTGSVEIKRDITAWKRAELSLRQSEAKYRILAEKMHDVVWIINLDMKLIYVSPSTETTLGYTPEERMSMGIDECMLPESLDYAMQMLINEAVISQDARSDKDRGVLLELEYYHKDGTTRWLEQSINGIYDENGELTEIMGVAREITERKKTKDALQQSAESYRALFNNVTDAIYVLDADGKFIDVNDGAVRMYGYPHNILVGKDPSFTAAPGKNDLEKVVEMVKRAYNGEDQQFEFWGKRANGECFLKDVRLRSGVYFGQKVIVAMAQDITSRKETEILLKKENEELERRNKLLEEQINNHNHGHRSEKNSHSESS